ncbi:sigma 54-interacting transcriptional regulator [Sorangium sp. So ce385]|uniref:sigma 54-interacting transcriptional regulator n=1 Tax=Sorangium sp. So ce385 TaxID=3133308 RepID=UPI003F5C36C5
MGSPTAVTVREQAVVGSRVFSPEEIRRGVVLELSGRVVLLLRLARATEGGRGDQLGLVGESDALQQVRDEIRKVAERDIPVLIRGETGTGKELVARALHEASARRGRPFVAVNMAALPASLAGAELFGAERGAFTGAVKDRAGYFAQAEDGTLFLDEIGDAPLDVQIMLLRALETGEIMPVGGQRPRRVRARLVAATDANLEARIAAGNFSAALLYRLSSFEIALPPLRERRDDIGRLVLHFLRQELASAERAGEPRLEASCMGRLAEYDWPGNVRQLRNVVRQLVIGSMGEPTLEWSPALDRLLAAPEEPRPERAPRRKPTTVTEDELLSALRDVRWDLKAAAARLRISRTSLYALVDSSPRVRRVNDLSKEEVARCYKMCGGNLDAMVERLEVSRRALARRVRELGVR